jgi:crotonobetainyl-CoA:carnitine CoA-transferase CaiB-like acyl-CoA transferase
LAGIKVVELVRIIAGPVIGCTLAALGADVIRVNCSRLTDLNVCNLQQYLMQLKLTHYHTGPAAYPKHGQANY